MHSISLRPTFHWVSCSCFLLTPGDNFGGGFVSLKCPSPIFQHPKKFWQCFSQFCQLCFYHHCCNPALASTFVITSSAVSSCCSFFRSFYWPHPALRSYLYFGYWCECDVFINVKSYWEYTYKGFIRQNFQLHHLGET